LANYAKPLSCYASIAGKPLLLGSLNMLDHMVCMHAHFGNSTMAEAAVGTDSTEYIVV